MLVLIFLQDGNPATIEHLNYHGHGPKKQIALYNSDTPVTLKEGQDQQTWYELITLGKVTIMQSLKDLP